jgi:hypothetical protein
MLSLGQQRSMVNCTRLYYTIKVYPWVWHGMSYFLLNDFFSSFELHRGVFGHFVNRENLKEEQL